MAQYDGSIRINTDISTKAAKKSLATLSNTIVLTAKKISSLRSKMDALKGQKFYTDDYKKLQSDLGGAEKKLAELVEKQNEWEKLGITSGGAWDTLNEEIAKASDNVDAIKEKMYQLEESGKAFILGENTQEYANLERQLQYEEEALRKAQQLQEIAKKTGDPYSRLSKSLNDLNSALSKIRHPIEAVKSSFAYMAEYIEAKLAGIAANVINGLVHPFQTLKNIAGGAINGVNKLLSGMVSIIKKAGIAIKSMASLLKKAASSMSLFGKSTKTSNNAFQTGFKNILKYGLGIRSLYALINKLRTAIKEGFSNMAKEVEGFGAKVDSLKASALTLKNSFAAAFRPLVEIAIPYIQKAIEYLTLFLDKVGQVMAAITGQKMYTKAIKQTTAAIKDQNKAQNRQLSSLDKLNNLTSDKGAGADSDGVGGMFEEVPVSSKFADIAQWLKDMWNKADFTELGTLLGKKLKNALDSIDWQPIKQAAAKVGKSIGTLINGFVEVKGLGESIGKTIGEAINTGIAGINAFLDNTHWDSVGIFIGEALNGLVDTISWEDIGHFFAAKFNAIFETIGEAARTFDWVKFGQELANSFNTFISDFDWEENGARLGDLIKGILDTLIAFLENTNWQELGNDVADFIGAIDWTGIMERLTRGIGAALGGFAAFLWGLIEDAWNSVINWWKERIFEDGKFTFEGFLKGILEWRFKIEGWIYENIFKPFIEGFKNAFGIHSPSTVMAEIGGYIIQGLLNGLKDMWSNVASWIDDKVQWVKDVFSSIKDSVSGFFSGGIFSGGFGKSVSTYSVFSESSPYSANPAFSALSSTPIPRLATGAVIPANREFLAVLGDQKHGTNIEAPLDTITQANEKAILNVFSKLGISAGNNRNSGNETFVFQVDGRTFFEITRKYAEEYFNRTGRSPYPI